ESHGAVLRRAVGLDSGKPAEVSPAQEFEFVRIERHAPTVEPQRLLMSRPFQPQLLRHSAVLFGESVVASGVLQVLVAMGGVFGGPFERPRGSFLTLCGSGQALGRQGQAVGGGSLCGLGPKTRLSGSFTGTRHSLCR